MQNTLKDLSVSELKDTLWDLNALLNYYKDKKLDLKFECPLCDTNDYLQDHEEHCDRCPWVILEGQRCDQVANSKFGEIKPTNYPDEDAIGRLTNWGQIIGLRASKHPDWVKYRVRMIKKWIRLYEKELNAES